MFGKRAMNTDEGKEVIAGWKCVERLSKVTTDKGVKTG